MLPDDQKLIIETARVIRVGFLQQNAFHKDDTYVPMEKQLGMLRAILNMHQRAAAAIARGIPLSRITATGLFDKLVKMKYEIPNDKLELLDEYIKETDRIMAGLTA